MWRLSNVSKARSRNCSIDIFRYICAIMVVAIHVHPFSDINAELGDFFTQIVPRIGVPFFFTIAGYFYIQRLEQGKNMFFPYIKRLLSVYIICSCIYYIVDFIQGGYHHPKNFIFTCVLKFTTIGSHAHFWFFPALIFSVCCTTLIFKIGFQKILIPCSIFLYVIGCLGCSYYKLGIAIPFLEKFYLHSQFTLIRRIVLMGFPFFVCGYLIFKIQKKIERFSTARKLMIIWLATAVLYLIEIYAVRALGWQKNIIITPGLYLLVIITVLLLLKYPLPQWQAFSEKSRLAANFTYYAHPLCMSLISFFTKRIFDFSLTVILTFAGSFVIYKLDNRFLNRLSN